MVTISPSPAKHKHNCDSSAFVSAVEDAVMQMVQRAHSFQGPVIIGPEFWKEIRQSGLQRQEVLSAIDCLADRDFIYIATDGPATIVVGLGARHEHPV